MKQVRLKEVGDNQYPTITRDKWYDVVNEMRSKTQRYYCIMDDNHEERLAMQSGGNWEVRDIGEGGHVTHLVLDSDLRSIYDNVCEKKWRDRIRDAVPTFEPENTWADITEECRFESASRSPKEPGIIISKRKRTELEDYYNLLMLDNGMNWKSGDVEYKVEQGKLWRRLK